MTTAKNKIVGTIGLAVVVAGGLVANTGQDCVVWGDAASALCDNAIDCDSPSEIEAYICQTGVQWAMLPYPPHCAIKLQTECGDPLLGGHPDDLAALAASHKWMGEP